MIDIDGVNLASLPNSHLNKLLSNRIKSNVSIDHVTRLVEELQRRKAGGKQQPTGTSHAEISTAKLESVLVSLMRRGTTVETLHEAISIGAELHKRREDLARESARKHEELRQWGASLRDHQHTGAEQPWEGIDLTVTIIENKTKTGGAQIGRINRASLPKMYVVDVHFRNSDVGKTYSYLSLRPYKTGDVVVVNSPYTGLTTVDVVSCRTSSIEDDFENGSNNYKWIIGLPPKHTEEDVRDLAMLQKALNEEGRKASAVSALVKLRNSNPAVAAILDKHNVKL